MSEAPQNPSAPRPESGPDAWDEVMQTFTPTGAPLVRDGLPPYHFGNAPALLVDPQCPTCGRVSHWKQWQTLGATPGRPGHPASRGGVIYRCGLCGTEAEYHLPALTEAEVAAFTARLLRGPMLR